MTGTRLRYALTYAARGWPVFPCQVGQKAPATAHGHLDATTDPAQITAWFSRNPSWNLAIATGAPGPDVLDVDDHGPAGNGYAAFARLSKAGLLDGAAAYVRTPGGALHENVALTGHVAPDTRTADVAGVMREISDVQAEHEARLRYKALLQEQS
jgi:hypothetical protein